MGEKTFFLKLRERPFEAMKRGTKKIEVRANNKSKDPNSVNHMSPRDLIIFTNENSGERMTCFIERLTLYSTVRELLLKEGTESTLSSNKDIEEGIKSIESISNYKETIAKN